MPTWAKIGCFTELFSLFCIVAGFIREQYSMGLRILSMGNLHTMLCSIFWKGVAKVLARTSGIPCLRRLSTPTFSLYYEIYTGAAAPEANSTGVLARAFTTPLLYILQRRKNSTFLILLSEGALQISFSA